MVLRLFCLLALLVVLASSSILCYFQTELFGFSNQFLFCFAQTSKADILQVMLDAETTEDFQETEIRNGNILFLVPTDRHFVK